MKISYDALHATFVQVEQEEGRQTLEVFSSLKCSCPLSLEKYVSILEKHYFLWRLSLS